MTPEEQTQLRELIELQSESIKLQRESLTLLTDLRKLILGKRLIAAEQRAENRRNQKRAALGMTAIPDAPKTRFERKLALAKLLHSVTKRVFSDPPTLSSDKDIISNDRASTTERSDS